MQERKVFLSRSMWVRYMPMAETIQKVIKSGMIGTPRMITANLSYPMLHKERLINADLAGGSIVGCRSLCTDVCGYVQIIVCR